MAVINNFVDIEDVKYYAKKQPFEEKPKLPRAMVEPLHRLVMTVNIYYIKNHTGCQKNNCHPYNTKYCPFLIVSCKSYKEIHIG